MRAFACPVCSEFAAFESDRCASCQTSLGLPPAGSGKLGFVHRVIRETARAAED